MEIDLKDKKLIYELDFNARMSLTQLGKKIGLSKQSVKYRLDSLQKKDIIQGFYTDINASKIGLSIYLVYFNFQNMSPQTEKEFISDVSKQESVGVSVSTNGGWNYCIGIWAESVIHFKNSYRKIMKDYEEYVKSKTIMIETDFHYFKPKQIHQDKNNPEIIMKGETEKFPLDEIDREILSLLAEDARMPLIDISEKINLSPNAIKLRIKQLEKNNIILGYRVMINYPLLNFLHYRVFLHLTNLTEESENKIIGFLKNQKSVVSVTKTIGFCELEFRTIVKDIHEFYSLMEDLRSKFSNLNDYFSIIYYKFHKALNYFPIKTN